MLRFPAEPADAERVVGLRHRNLCESAALGQRLCGYVVLEGRVCQAFHKTIAERAQRDAEGFNRLSR